MGEGVHLAVDRVGADVVGIYLKRVGVHPQRVLLRVVEHQGTVGGIAITGLLVVEDVLGTKLVLVLLVYIHYVAESLVKPGLAVVVQRVARYRLVLVYNGRAAEELRLVGVRIEVGIRCVDYAALGHYGRRANDVRHGCAGVVVKGIGCDVVLARVHLDTIVERSLACGCAVSAPVGHKAVFAVDQLAALEEVGKVVYTVVVERVGIQCLRAMLQHHVVACVHHLVGSVIVGIVARKRQGIALAEVYVSESLNRV